MERNKAQTKSLSNKKTESGKEISTSTKTTRSCGKCRKNSTNC